MLVFTFRVLCEHVVFSSLPICIWLYFCISVCITIHLSVYPSTSPFIYPSIHPSIHPFAVPGIEPGDLHMAPLEPFPSHWCFVTEHSVPVLTVLPHTRTADIRVVRARCHSPECVLKTERACMYEREGDRPHVYSRHFGVMGDFYYSS
jgi:hypothetical protein